jgi:alkylation response protein AidB-like acyl-CoA dehydrogenase
MDFRFSAEQDALRDSVRSFLSAEAPPSFVRSRFDEPIALPDAMWRHVVDLGWTALLVPESHGGLGLGLVDVVVVQEELGRALFPGPFLSSAVLATLAAGALGLVDELRALACGDARGTVALDESGHGDPVDRVATRATGRADLYRLDGTKPLVLDAVGADWVLVPARTREGLQTFLVESPAANPADTLDVTRHFGTLEFEATPARRVGPAGDHTAIWRRVADDAAVAISAELIGVGEAANQLAIDYAQARVVFDKPLSKFQVTRHKAVDMLRAVELARVGTHYAAWASDVDAPERASAVAMAKSSAAEAANFVTAECIQVHGGVGFTWDCDAHLLLRRAKVDDLLLGAQAWQRSRVADQYFASL